MSDAVLARELRARWSADLGRSGPAKNALAGVLARYAEPNRRYHTARHVAHVLRDVQRLAAAVGLDADSTRTVRLAAWFHDAVYDPHAAAGVNEAASAGLAGRVLAGLGEPAATAAEVVRLILLTASHDPGGGDRAGVDMADVDMAGAVLVDADLGVLGAEPAAYQAYVRGVRAEYAHVDDAGWRAGRAAVLQRFLDRPRLYRLDVEPGREGRAHANLAAELASLIPPSPASVESP